MQRINRRRFLALSGGALAFAGLAPRATRAASVTLTEADIVLQTATGNIYGTLALPAAAKGAVPAVLLIAGSGPTDRNGNGGGVQPDTLRLIAQGLAARGVASVRYDKRFIGASASKTMREQDLRFNMYFEDAAAWIALMRNDSRFSRVIVAGHSEGALLGTIAAERGGVAALVTLDGAGRPAATILREQLQNSPPAIVARANDIQAQLQAGKLYTGPIPEALQPFFRPSIQPYLISWYKYDPAVELGKVHAPVTIVQGTADIQVSMADAQALKRGNPSAKLVIVQGMNHVLKHAPDTSTRVAILAGYMNSSLPVEPQVLDALASAAGA